jgi:hypothetical protein
VRHKIKCAISAGGGTAGCREERTDRAKAKIKASPMKMEHAGTAPSIEPWRSGAAASRRFT